MLEVISAADPQALAWANRALLQGEVVAFPTDTVYGIGVRISDRRAIDQLYAIKGRSLEKAIAVLIASPDQLPGLTPSVPDYARRLMDRFWPGALTLVLPRLASLPGNLSPYPTLGIRIPDHPFAQDLCSACGPLAVTSANLSGQPSPTSAEEVRRQIGDRIGWLVDGGTCPGGTASTVLDCTGPAPRVLREGALPADKLFRALE